MAPLGNMTLEFEYIKEFKCSFEYFAKNIVFQESKAQVVGDIAAESTASLTAGESSAAESTTDSAD
jgi:hypothetical protein